MSSADRRGTIIAAFNCASARQDRACGLASSSAVRAVEQVSSTMPHHNIEHNGGSRKSSTTIENAGADKRQQTELRLLASYLDVSINSHRLLSAIHQARVSCVCSPCPSLVGSGLGVSLLGLPALTSLSFRLPQLLSTTCVSLSFFLLFLLCVCAHHLCAAVVASAALAAFAACALSWWSNM